MERHNIAIALPLEEELLRPLHAWGKRFDFSHVFGVHFVHVVKKNITPLEFGLMEMPDESTFREMVPPISKFMKDEAKKILPPDFKGEVHYHVSSHFDPEGELVEAIKRYKVNLMVVATRGKHGFDGLFHSSVTEHLIKFAPCDVYVVRPLST